MPAVTERAAPPSRPSDDTLRKATEDAFQKGRAEGIRDAREEVDALMFRWWQKAALESGRVSKAKLDALTDTMTEKDVRAMNEVLNLLRDSGVLDFDGEIYEAREAG
jgi:flagellar biosynthesis/type III secretory pathway protein FliH